MLLTYKAARTLGSLVLILPIVSILSPTVIIADQFETLRAQPKCISPHPPYEMSPYFGGFSAAQCCNPLSKTVCSKHEKGALAPSQYFTRSPGGLQYQSLPLAKRGIKSNLAIIIGNLAVVANSSALTSYIYTQFYRNMTLIWANREQWVSTFSSFTYHFLRASRGLRHIGATWAPKIRL